MSNIQTQIDRITTAKADIKTAIENKGVSVPDNTMIDGMAALIDSITAGGGGSNIKIASGTYRYNDAASTTTPIPITHGLGATPNYIIVYDTDGTGTYPTGTQWALYMAIYDNGNVTTVVKTKPAYASNLDLYNSTVIGITSVTAEQFSIGGNYAYPIKHTYKWIAIAEG